MIELGVGHLLILQIIMLPNIMKYLFFVIINSILIPGKIFTSLPHPHSIDLNAFN